MNGKSHVSAMESRAMEEEEMKITMKRKKERRKAMNKHKGERS